MQLLLLTKKMVGILPAPVLLLDAPKRASLFLKIFTVGKNKLAKGNDVGIVLTKKQHSSPSYRWLVLGG